ncbi:hypothetical protein D7X88_05315 [bacterium C-53]|nr:hypothetical protein [Lachnospiraceae bacterium]NBI02640.1 hypothetical protein [Lachnospiraceae bacterium]RKJ11279.1 hypothetical protein D7X88_05315 [bacterium C-53]
MSSIFYFFCLVFCLSGCFAIKKSEKKLNSVCHIFISLYFVMCYQVLAAVVLSFIPHGISILTISVADFILGLVCWGSVWRKKESQKYQLQKVDVLAMGIFIALALFWGMHQFGTSLDIFNYRSTIDCTRHLLFARQFAVKHSLASIPFMAINTGLWFEALYPFMHPYHDFKLIIRTDVAMIFMSSVMFWALIRNHLKSNIHIIIGIIATVLYTSGFPVNNMVFGTSYLGAGVTCVIMVCIFISMYREDEISIPLLGCGLVVSMIGLLKAYPLFFPIILVSVVIFLSHQFLEKKFHAQKWFRFSIPVLAVLCAICIVIIFEFMPYGDLTREGYIYRNLFSHFVFLLPFLFYRIYWCIKENKIKLDYVMSLFGGLFVCALLIATYIAKMSTYYYYKSYYLFWMMIFYVAVMVMVNLGCEALKMIAATFFTISLIVFYSISGLENKIQSTTENRGKKINEGMTISQFFDLHNWNYSKGDKRNMCISPEEQELFQKVAQLTEGEEIQTPYIGRYCYHQFCYYTMAYQWENESERLAYIDSDEFIETVKEECKYLCLLYEEAGQSPWDISDYLATLEIEYQNDAGIIYKVH